MRDGPPGWKFPASVAAVGAFFTATSLVQALVVPEARLGPAFYFWVLVLVVAGALAVHRLRSAGRTGEASADPGGESPGTESQP